MDLTSVLRVGFRLSFHAVSANDSNNYIANYVSPISDTVFYRIFDIIIYTKL